MAPDDQKVISFYVSGTARERTLHILRTLFLSQLLLLCGPTVVAVMMNLALFGHSLGPKALFIASAGVTIWTGWRAWSSMKYRNRVMERLFNNIDDVQKSCGGKLFDKKKEENNQPQRGFLEPHQQ